ncbi:MAG: hypothetical protein DI537_28410 [Stutzerimonas stutzeri]|nr:MAG: hypothetical protein DI537_28410 [Stutzerimonas stutzeri]
MTEGRFSNRVRAVRVSKNLDIADLAAKAGISPSYLGMIERGVRVANAEVLARLAAALDVTTNDLLSAGLAAEANTLWQHLVAKKGEVGGPFGLKLKMLRDARGLSVRALCEGEGGAASGLKAWLVREFELGGRDPTPDEFSQLAVAFGFRRPEDLREALDATVSPKGGAGLDIRSRPGFDRSSNDWPELVLRATSRGLTNDQVVVDGRELDASFFLVNAKILADRSLSVEEGDLVLVANRSVFTGIGRVVDGQVRGESGASLRGTPWRVVSILFP